MTRIRYFIAIVLIILALPDIPWIFTTFPLATEGSSGIEFEWLDWMSHILVVGGFSISGYLTYINSRYWLLPTLLICGFVTFIATTPFIRMALDSGFFSLTRPIINQAINSGGTRGFYLIWNLIVLPVLPALLIPLSGLVWLGTMENNNMESNNALKEGTPTSGAP